MRNFSQIVARKQRQASELQLRVTWGAIKEVSKTIGANIKKTEEAYTKDIIRKRILRGRKLDHFTAPQLRELEEEVNRSFAVGVSEDIAAKAKKLTAEKLSEEINVYETYKDLDWRTFKRGQKEILQRYYNLFGSQNRDLWDKAFAIYYEKGLNKYKR